MEGAFIPAGGKPPGRGGEGGMRWGGGSGSVSEKKPTETAVDDVVGHFDTGDTPSDVKSCHPRERG